MAATAAAHLPRARIESLGKDSKGAEVVLCKIDAHMDGVSLPCDPKYAAAGSRLFPDSIAGVPPPVMQLSQ
jgi:hypothetical protein